MRTPKLAGSGMGAYTATGSPGRVGSSRVPLKVGEGAVVVVVAVAEASGLGTGMSRCEAVAERMARRSLDWVTR